MVAAQATREESREESREDRLLDTIERLERRLEHLDEAMSRLEGAARQVPVIVATVTDVVDSVIARLAVRGFDVDERLRALAQAVDQLTSPRALDALGSVLQSEIMAHQTTEVIGRIGRAIVHAEHDAKPVGMWGVMRALRDPEVQRAAGFVIAMARRFGEELKQVPQLTAGGES